MNIDQFTDLVAEMRKAQKEYFRTRSSQFLNDAKNLERRVDDALARFANVSLSQPSIFQENQ